LGSCSSVPTVPKDVPYQGQRECNFTPKGKEQKHLVMAAKIRSSVLARCYKHFLKFEEKKKQYIPTCNQLSVHHSGKVRWVQITHAQGKQLPRDLVMCMKQEFWKMKFSGLQLSQSQIISFRLNFSSI